MEDEDKPVRIETDKARAGSTPHVVRYMLAISLTCTILGMLLIWIFWHG